MSQRTAHPMSHFDDHDDQDLQDLRYGEQQAACERFAKEVPITFEETSITRSWSPEDD